MSEGLAILVSALPGAAALVAGAARWRVAARAGRTWKHLPPLARLALLVLAALAIGACHTTHDGHYARGPVPQTLVPFAEPLRYSVAPQTGELVETRNGLLASYFAGARYDRLDHQQIDTEVAFQWNADRQNPVVSGAESLDTDEGCGSWCGLPPFWGIWSVVWEGYLDAQLEGTYGLRIHVNNGGWLEMKGDSGALTTVISCPGAPGFEGDCDADVALTAGRHYIRFSYYQNGPPSANAYLRWRVPGSTAFVDVPSASLWTQLGVPDSRGFVFVHGISGDFTDPGFSAILDQLPLRGVFKPYEYVHDVGHLQNGTCQPRDIPTYDPSSGMPVDFPSAGELRLCDSNDDVGLNALRLDQDIRDFVRDRSLTRVTIISNSMGGAIVRAYLAYAEAIASDTLEHIDGLLFLQAAHQGSYLATLHSYVDQNPVLAPIGQAITQEVKERQGIDVERAAFADLTPRSDLYQYVNRSANVPNSISYGNVASDIVVRPVVIMAPWHYPLSARIGDYLLLPGQDEPSALPALGGARFMPATEGRGRASDQWILPRVEVVIFLGPLPVRLPDLHAPESHLAFGNRLQEIRVPTAAGPRHLDDVLLAWIDGLAAPR